MTVQLVTCCSQSQTPQGGESCRVKMGVSARPGRRASSGQAGRGGEGRSGGGEQAAAPHGAVPQVSLAAWEAGDWNLFKRKWISHET